MYRVITVAREYGSGGSAIAMSVAQRLNWKLLDKELVAVLARTAQVDIETARRYDEAVDSWWHRINRSGLLAAAVAAGATPDVAQAFDAGKMAALTEKLISEAAMKGDCVIVGRGGHACWKAAPRPFTSSFMRRGNSVSLASKSGRQAVAISGSHSDPPTGHQRRTSEGTSSGIGRILISTT
jgi:hypothetical protein